MVEVVSSVLKCNVGAFGPRVPVACPLTASLARESLVACSWVARRYIWTLEEDAPMEDAPLPEPATADQLIEDMMDIQKFRIPTLSIKLDVF